MNNIQRVGAILKVKKIKAVTSNGQEAALAFYHRNNWTEVSCFYNIKLEYIIQFFFLKASRVYHTGIIHGIKLVTFWKDVNSPSPSQPKQEETKPRTSQPLETLLE